MRKKVILIVIVLLVLILCSGIVGGVYFIKRRNDDICLLKTNVIIEYGTTYNPTLEELIDSNCFNYINKNEIILNNEISNEDNKDYPAVGIYEIRLNYKNKELVQKVEVKDTTSPEVVMQENIEIQKDTDLPTYNFKEFITISDLSEIKDYIINLDNVDSSKSGEYIAKVIVQDIYSNQTEKEFKIIITETKANDEETDEDLNNSQETVKTNNSDVTTNNNTTQKETNINSKTQSSNNTTSTTNKNQTDTNNTQSTTNKTQNTTKNTQSTTNNTQNTENNVQPNNNSSQATTNSENKQDNKTEISQEITNQKEKEKCTNNNNHAIGVGNSGKWFSTKNEAISYYNSQISYWGEKWESFQIDNDTYYKNCPYGYEIWSCMYCSKWTINFYYR